MSIFDINGVNNPNAESSEAFGIYDTSGVGASNSAMTSGQMYAGASAGISAISSIAGAIASTKAFEAQLKAQTDSKIQNMEYALNRFERNANKLKEDMDLLDQEFAGKISERRLKAMKDFATIKAASAGSGVTGGSTDEVTMQAYVDEAFDVAIINQRRENSLSAGMRRKEDAYVNAVNAFTSYASTGVSVNANALVSGISGGTEVLGSLLVSMPNDVKADFFGKETKAYT